MIYHRKKSNCSIENVMRYSLSWIIRIIYIYLSLLWFRALQQYQLVFPSQISFGAFSYLWVINLTTVTNDIATQIARVNIGPPDPRGPLGMLPSSANSFEYPYSLSYCHGENGSILSTRNPLNAYNVLKHLRLDNHTSKTENVINPYSISILVVLLKSRTKMKLDLWMPWCYQWRKTK